jgi:hypothetical protein
MHIRTVQGPRDGDFAKLSSLQIVRTNPDRAKRKYGMLKDFVVIVVG